MASINIGVSAASIFLAYHPLPHPPKLTGADAFQLFEHTAEVVQLSDAAFQTDFLDAFVGKPQHSFRMGDPHLLQISDQCHAVLLLEQPGQIVLVDEEVAGHRFQGQLLFIMLVQEGLYLTDFHLLRRVGVSLTVPG